MTHLNPKFEALRPLHTPATIDATEFRRDIEFIRRAGANMLKQHRILPDVEAETITALGYNPAHTLWPLDVAGQAIAAWKAALR